MSKLTVNKAIKKYENIKLQGGCSAEQYRNLIISVC